VVKKEESKGDENGDMKGMCNAISSETERVGKEKEKKRLVFVFENRRREKGEEMGGSWRRKR